MPQEQASLQIGDMIFPAIELIGKEALSTLFCFEITVLFPQSLIEGRLFNQSAILQMIDAKGHERNVCGIICFVEHTFHGGSSVATMHLVPRMRRLTYNAQPQIYLQKTVIDIVKDMLQKKVGYLPQQIQWCLQGDYPIYDFILQNTNESDFDFLQRLLAESGIYYYFTTEDGVELVRLLDNNALVLRKSPLAHRGSHGLQSEDSVYDVFKQQVKVVQQHQVAEFNETQPGEVLSHQAVAQVAGISSGEDYCFGGNIKTQRMGDAYLSTVSLNQFSQAEKYRGKSHSGDLYAGLLSRIDDVDNENKIYMIITVHHRAKYPVLGEGSGEVQPYRNTWEAIDAKKSYRSKPNHSSFHPGSCIAHIEAHPDQSAPLMDDGGRYKIRYALDEEKRQYNQASIPTRFVHPYGGGATSARAQQQTSWHQPLRDGAEVSVAYLAGNPNRPFLLSANPNAATQTPVTAQNYQQNRIKTSKKNELCMNDQPQKSAIYMQTRDKENALEMLANKEQTLNLTTKKGFINHFSKEDGTQKTDNNFYEIIKGKQDQQVEKDYQQQALQQDIYYQSGADVQWQNQQQALQSGAALEYTSGRELNKTIHQRLTVTPKAAMHYKSQKGDTLLSGSSLKIKSKGKVHISTGGAGILLEPGGQITIYGKSVGGVSYSSPSVNNMNTPGVNPGKPSAASPIINQAIPALTVKNKNTQTLKTHWVDLKYIDSDNNPIAYQPYTITFSDGSKHYGKLDAEGYARHEEISLGSVSIEYGSVKSKPKLEESLDQQLRRLVYFLRKMLGEIQEQAAIQNAELEKQGLLGKGEVYSEAFVDGLYEGAKGLVVGAYDAAKAMVKVTDESVQFSEKNFHYLTSGNVKAIKQEIGGAGNKVHADEETLKQFYLLISYQPIRDLLLDFAKKYFAFQSDPERVKIAGGLAFNLIFLICTAGEGGVIDVASVTEKADASKISAEGVFASRYISQVADTVDVVAKDLDELQRIKQVDGEVDRVVESKLGNNSVESIRKLQMDFGYNADEFNVVRFKKGHKFVGGLPGRSPFYTSLESLDKSGYSKSALFNKLQVEPHPLLGYRSNVGVYELLEDLELPCGIVKANPQFGSGGFEQYVIENHVNKLQLLEKIELKE